MLREAINSVCYIYDADFCDLEELHQAGAEEELAKWVYFVLCARTYNVKRQSELENIIHDASELNDMDDFCDLAKHLINYGDHGHRFFNPLQSFLS